MADATLQHDAVGHSLPGEYEAPLFGAYSKKVGMWLFLASDSLTFGALLFAFSYNRIYTNPWPTPFHVASITNATIMTACLLSSSLTMVLGVFAAQRGDRAWMRNWLLATMVFGTAFIVLHGMEWTKLIGEGLTLPGFPKPASAATGELADVSKAVPQFAARLDPAWPVRHQRIADAAAMGVLLIALQGRVGRHGPAPGKVGMGVRTADIVEPP